MSQNQQLRAAIRKLVREEISCLDDEEDLEEVSVTGNVSGFNTPAAFSGEETAKGRKKKGRHGGNHTTHEGGCRKPEVLGYKLVEGRGKKPVITNRWLELKNDTSMNAVQKIGVGIRELNGQLREVESFVRWYKKLQVENDLEGDAHWKRTQKHVYKIKERIINIAKDIQEIM